MHFCIVSSSPGTRQGWYVTPSGLGPFDGFLCGLKGHVLMHDLGC